MHHTNTHVLQYSAHTKLYCAYVLLSSASQQMPGQTAAATVVVHCPVPHTMQCSASQSISAGEESVTAVMLNSRAKDLIPGKIAMYTRKSGFNGLTYAVKNTHTQALRFTMDCSSGVNVSSHRGCLAHTVTIAPGEAEIMHHILPMDAMKGWQSGYSATVVWV